MKSVIGIVDSLGERVMISYLLANEHPGVGDMSEMVSGAERWKYHKRPLQPMMVENEDQFAQDENTAQNELDEYPRLQAEESQMSRLQSQKYRDVGCQTIQREQGTQTEPFSPKLANELDFKPEVRILEKHKFGNGLPATMEEMYFIEEQREKTAFFGALPPTSDEACFMLRRRLMEDHENREWKKREAELKKVQNERQNLLQSALIAREKDTEEYGAKRIEAIRAKKTEEKNRLVAKIQRRKIKILRKILKTKKKLEKDERKRDIVEEYHNFASRVYANITREGLSLDKLSNKFEVQPYSLQSYEEFENLVAMIKPSYLHSTFNLKEFSDKMQTKYKKLEIIHRNKLREAQEQIERNAKKHLEEDQRNLEDEKKNEFVARPDTPIIDYSKGESTKDQDELKLEDGKKDDNVNQMNMRYKEANKREEAIILLQRLILGRAIQNTMFEGKEKRMALIEELLIVSNIKELDKQKEQELLMEQHQQRVKNAFVEALQGEAISETLEGLSKELLRFKEEKKISKFVKQAEDERRKREAEETGRRQAELTLRKRENVLYAEIMKVHQGTVDSYLRRIMGRAVDHLATKQAWKLTSLHREKVEQTLKDTKRQEVLIKDMVSSLLVPNVERMKVARRVNLEQQRYNLAVRETLDQAFKEAKNEMQNQ